MTRDRTLIHASPIVACWWQVSSWRCPRGICSREARSNTPASAPSCYRHVDAFSLRLGVASAQRSRRHTSMMLTDVRDHLSLVLAVARTAVHYRPFEEVCVVLIASADELLRFADTHDWMLTPSAQYGFNKRPEATSTHMGFRSRMRG